MYGEVAAKRATPAPAEKLSALLTQPVIVMDHHSSDGFVLRSIENRWKSL
jgi:hypothetical protein